jgi:hypothetical protein
METRTVLMKMGALAVLAVMLLVSFIGTTTGQEPNGGECDTSGTFDLLAGQNMVVGSVMIWHDNEMLYIKYTTDGDWYLYETHVFVGDQADLPTNKKGNPQIGHFPYSETHDMVQMYTYEFSLDDLGWEQGDELFIMAHAVVNRVVNDEVVQSETAWGCEYDYEESQRWACYIDYTPCKVLEMPEGLVDIVASGGGGDSYIDTTVSDGGNDVPSATYDGWCFDEDQLIYLGTHYDATLYSSYDPFLPPSLQDDDWDLINYIINHKQDYFDAGYTVLNIEHVIWYFMEDPDWTWDDLNTNEKAIAQDAIDNGEGFYPAHLQYMAVIVYISDSVQGTFIEVDP